MEIGNLAAQLPPFRHNPCHHSDHMVVPDLCFSGFFFFFGKKAPCMIRNNHFVCCSSLPFNICASVGHCLSVLGNLRILFHGV